MRLQVGLGLVLGLLSMVALADPVQPVLHQVEFQTSAEQWVTTKTAEVVVTVNATLSENALAKAHSDILQKLDKLADADWHVIQFDRSPNQSGLEQLLVQAQTRLPETALSDLRDRAKSLSQPGETFTVSSITFVPTLAETEAVRTQLRAQIYTQVQNELTTLNKMYPTQHYVVHAINFMEDGGPRPVPQAKMMLAVAESNDAGAAPLTVANKMIMSASVNLVSVEQPE